MLLVENVKGIGAPVEAMCRVTVDFIAIVEGGLVVTDTERRGMPFTFLFGQDSVQPFWHAALAGARVGDVRTVQLAASAAGLVLEGDPPLTLVVSVTKVAPLSSLPAPRQGR